uniref:Uncharacterized protein n=1 Tax=Hordeum vulgare subsp. vulgare TaxID=112509 RepID=A0A8I6YHN7_HORVV
MAMAQRGPEQERLLPRDDEPLPLLHVQRRGGHLPVEALHQRRQECRHGQQGQPHAGARAPPAPERHQLQVLPLRVHALAGPAGHEPLRPELKWVLPPRRVAPNGVDVEEDGRPGRDGVPAHADRLHRLPVRDHRRRAQPQRLLEHRLQVRHLRYVRLAHHPGRAHHRLQLCAQLLQAVRVRQQLRQHPLHGGRRRVRPGREDVLLVSFDIRQAELTLMSDRWTTARGRECGGSTHEDEGLDVVPGELDLGGGVCGGVHEDVEQVLGVAPVGALAPLLLLAPDDGLEQRVEPGVHAARPAGQPLQVPAAKQRHVVLEVESADELGHLLGAVAGQVRHVAGQRAGHHPHHGVVRQPDELPAHVQRLALRGRRGGRAHDAGELGGADGAEQLDGARAEQLRHAEALHEAPVRAVGREGEAGGAVGELPRDGRLGPLRDAALELEHVAGDVGGADDDAVRGGAEAEVDERAVAGEDAVEGAVRGLADEVQVADERERHGARGQAALLAAAAMPADQGADEEEGDGDGGDDEQRRCTSVGDHSHSHAH